jgi:beta-glucosidase
MSIPFPLQRLGLSLLAAALSFAGVPGRAADAPEAVATNAAAAPRTNTAIIPALNPRFMTRHTNFVEIARKGHIDILFMGDSITDFWRSSPPNGGREVFDKYYGKLRVANFGIAGDTTQGVLWRLQNGEGQGYRPRVVMLMIGTNNTGGAGGGNTAAEIAEGVEAVVAEIRKDFPKAKILLLAVFPRGHPGDPVRTKIAAVNQQIGGLSDFNHVFYYDIGAKFLDNDGNFLPGVFRTDNLHPAAPGYEIWANAVKEPLATLMK